MHTKIIQSGTTIEVFEYENDPPTPKGTRKKARYRNPKRYTRSVQRARSSFFRLVRSNVSATARPALATFTMREVVEIGQGYRAFTLFAQRLRRATAGKVSFIAVPEFQKRGAVHFHALVWGLSDEEIIGERSSRRIAQLWGHGFCDLRPTDGGDRLVGYLTKYMSKGLFDDRLRGKKAYSCSRNIVRSVSLNTPTAVDVSKEVWGIGVDNEPLTEKSYTTKWMGRCDYKVYKI